MDRTGHAVIRSNLEDFGSVLACRPLRIRRHEPFDVSLLPAVVVNDEDVDIARLGPGEAVDLLFVKREVFFQRLSSRKLANP